MAWPTTVLFPEDAGENFNLAIYRVQEDAFGNPVPVVGGGGGDSNHFIRVGGEWVPIEPA